LTKSNKWKEPDGEPSIHSFTIEGSLTLDKSDNTLVLGEAPSALGSYQMMELVDSGNKPDGKPVNIYCHFCLSSLK